MDSNFETCFPGVYKGIYVKIENQNEVLFCSLLTVCFAALKYLVAICDPILGTANVRSRSRRQWGKGVLF